MTCSPLYCKNEKFENFNKCTLHCSNDDIDDRNRDSHKLKFYTDFHNYIFQKLEENNSYKEYDIEGQTAKNEKILSDAKKFNWIEVDEIESYKNNFFEIIKNDVICLKGINFPEYVIHYLNGDISILENIGKVVFEKCNFHNSWESRSKNIFYEDCVFYKFLDIKVYEEYLHAEEKSDNDYGDKNGYRYKRCKFEGDVYIEGQGSVYTDPSYISYNVFLDCQFVGNIELSNVKLRYAFISISDVFKGIKKIENEKQHEKLLSKYKSIYNFKDIIIKDSEFDDSFKINGLDIDYLDKNKIKYEESINNLIYEFKDISEIKKISIKDSKFNKKFEMKSTHVEELELNNSNVDGIFDLFKSKLKKAIFYKNIFSDFTGFEKVEFGKKGSAIDNYQTKFIYTTFMSFSNFRSTKFHSGLDFENSNLKEQPNFLKTYISSENTNRETFRIIKHSFDSSGNKLEANKFFIKEMQAYKEELYNIRSKEINDIEKLKKDNNKNGIRKYKKSESYKESRRARWVFNTNNFLSSFGENYEKPIIFLVILGFVYTLISLWHTSYFDSHEYFLSCVWIDGIFRGFNKFAVNILPFSAFIEHGNGIEFISLFFYILFAILTWQIIVAVKRHTQR